MKDNCDFGINFFNAGPSASIQYCKIGRFAEYSPIPFLKDGEGPKTHRFTIGLILW